MGQASPQPIVTTTSAARTAAPVSGFGNSRLTSRPISDIACTTTGFTDVDGSEPAERTWILPPPRRSSRAAAICDLPALCTQTKRTSGILDDLGHQAPGLGRQVVAQPVVGPDALLLAIDEAGLAQPGHVMRHRRLR